MDASYRIVALDAEGRRVVVRCQCDDVASVRFPQVEDFSAETVQAACEQELADFAAERAAVVAIPDDAAKLIGVDQSPVSLPAARVANG